MQAKSWGKVFESYDKLGLYADAATALCQGGKFNQLVEYLAKCVVGSFAELGSACFGIN